VLLSEALLQLADEPGKPTTTPRELLLPRDGSRQPLFTLLKPLSVAAAAGAAAAGGAGSSASPRSQLNSKLVQLLLLLPLLLPKQASKPSPS
jgi:hypothetical protein